MFRCVYRSTCPPVPSGTTTRLAIVRPGSGFKFEKAPLLTGVGETWTKPSAVGEATVTFNTTADTPEVGTLPRPATCNVTTCWPVNNALIGDRAATHRQSRSWVGIEFGHVTVEREVVIVIGLRFGLWPRNRGSSSCPPDCQPETRAEALAEAVWVASAERAACSRCCCTCRECASASPARACQRHAGGGGTKYLKTSTRTSVVNVEKTAPLPPLLHRAGQRRRWGSSCPAKSRFSVELEPIVARPVGNTCRKPLPCERCRAVTSSTTAIVFAGTSEPVIWKSRVRVRHRAGAPVRVSAMRHSV